VPEENETKEDTEGDSMIKDIMRSVGRTRNGDLIPDEPMETVGT
jgi:hypothetical protein